MHAAPLARLLFVQLRRWLLHLHSMPDQATWCFATPIVGAWHMQNQDVSAKFAWCIKRIWHRCLGQTAGTKCFSYIQLSKEPSSKPAGKFQTLTMICKNLKDPDNTFLSSIAYTATEKKIQRIFLPRHEKVTWTICCRNQLYIII